MLNGLEYGGTALLNIVIDGGSIFPDDLQEEVVEMVVPEGGGEPIRTVTTAGPTQAQVLQYNKDIDQWNLLNSKAKFLLYTSCEEGPREAVEDEQFATDRWRRLQARYQESGFAQRRNKMKLLQKTTIANSENSVEKYVENIRTRAKDIKKMGAGIDEW